MLTGTSWTSAFRLGFDLLDDAAVGLGAVAAKDRPVTQVIEFQVGGVSNLFVFGDRFFYGSKLIVEVGVVECLAPAYVTQAVIG